MKYFDKRFVYCVWDNSLVGKEVFVADHLANLSDPDGKPRYEVLKGQGTVNLPFRARNGTLYRYAYYDPYWEYKKAFDEGKTILCRRKPGDDWEDDRCPIWSEQYEYRVRLEEYDVKPINDVDKALEDMDSLVHAEKEALDAVKRLNEFKAGKYFLVRFNGEELEEVHG